jgi:hypothetical protein
MHFFFLTKIQLVDMIYQVRLNTAPSVCENHKNMLLVNHMQTIIIQHASSVLGGAGYVRHLLEPLNTKPLYMLLWSNIYILIAAYVRNYIKAIPKIRKAVPYLPQWEVYFPSITHTFTPTTHIHWMCNRRNAQQYEASTSRSVKTTTDQHMKLGKLDKRHSSYYANSVK